MKLNELYIPGLTQRYSIGTLYCIGRNYAKHAEELGNELPSEPVVFIKPNSSGVFNEGTIKLPKVSQNVHHEVERVAAIGNKGKDIPEKEASDYIAGYGLGIDVTARDLQSKAKQNGLPWSVAKGFDTFAPISSFVEPEEIKNINDTRLKLLVNGDARQNGSTRHMIFNVPYLISYLSSIFTLYPGDLIFTGTPEGVSQIVSGDQIEAWLGDRIVTLQIKVK